jgi:DNA-binding transcriptional LysR family regulator
VTPVEFRRGHLQYFVTVAEEGQITRAARKLHLAQPALSQAIAQLETDLGIELLERHARGVRLTPAGEIFLVKARKAVTAWAEALETAQSIARMRKGTIEFGFVGSPPAMDSPGPLEAFTAMHPEIEMRFRELPFPTAPTSSWLAEVDLVSCHLPPSEDGVWSHLLRREPRAVLVPKRHPLAERSSLRVADVIDETFIGLHTSVEPSWGGFWSLDDERGSPPQQVTGDHAAKPQEVLAALAVGRAITTVPASVARVIMNFPTGVVAIRLLDAAPASIVLCGRDDRHGALVGALLAFARSRQAASNAPRVRDAVSQTPGMSDAVSQTLDGAS